MDEDDNTPDDNGLKARFDQFEDDFLIFDRIAVPLHQRPDLCAFLLLAQLTPNGKFDMVSAAEHDQIWLDVDADDVASIITDEQILMLVRCGVMYDEDNESFSMYV